MAGCGFPLMAIGIGGGLTFAVPSCVFAGVSPACARSSLPTGDFGMVVDEHVAARALEVREPRRRGRTASSSLGLDRCAALDEGRDDLAPALVGQADDRDFRHRRCSDRQLSISTGETFSPPVMIMSSTRPVTNRSPSASKVAGVAGEVPALAQRLGVGIGAAPVALERFVALQQRDDLAFLAGRGDLVRRRRAEPHHAHHLVDAGAAGRAGLCRRVLVDGEGVDLRRAVMIDEQVRLERRLQFLEQAVGHRRAGKAELAHRGDVGLARSAGDARGRDRASAPDRDW